MKNKNDKGLFEEEFRLVKLSKQNDPLVLLKGLIPWNIFTGTLNDIFKKEEKGIGGREPFEYLLMFKILILQRYYNLSDDQTEYQILDRLSFMRFLDLKLSDKVPDSKTIWYTFNDNLQKKEKYLKHGKKISINYHRKIKMQDGPRKIIFHILDIKTIQKLIKRVN